MNYICRWVCLPPQAGRLAIETQKTLSAQLQQMALQEVSRLAQMPVEALPPICRTAQGKPQFASPIGWYFNWSHSGFGGMLVVANCPCGCDLQQMVPVDAKIFRRVCTSEEQAALEALPDEAERAGLFFQCWTKKEAVTKALGQSIWQIAPRVCCLSDQPVSSKVGLLPKDITLLCPQMPPWAEAFCSAICLIPRP